MSDMAILRQLTLAYVRRAIRTCAVSTRVFSSLRIKPRVTSPLTCAANSP
jgi:hypothetical protein